MNTNDNQPRIEVKVDRRLAWYQGDSVRYICIDGAPRYLAMYDTQNVDVFNTPGYLKVSFDNSSPWTKRVTSRVRVYRSAGEQVYPGNALASAQLGQKGEPIAVGEVEIEKDQADVGMGVGEDLRPAPDLGEQVVLIEVQVRRVEAGHGVRTLPGSRRAAASRPARS